MAIKTYTEQLEEVQAAIAEIEARGQAVGTNGSVKTRADLDVLYKREERLRVLAGRESAGTGIRVRQVVPRG